jgi:hypothetical protein
MMPRTRLVELSIWVFAIVAFLLLLLMVLGEIRV